MRFTVQRNKWRSGGGISTAALAGSGRGETLLLNQHGYRCCLGFVCSQLGVADTDLKFVAGPVALAERGRFDSKNLPDDLRQQVIEQLRYRQGLQTRSMTSDLTRAAVAINDNGDISRDERERKLTDLFATYGHELVFEGEYEPTPEVPCA